jgi:hypothetical protein
MKLLFLTPGTGSYYCGVCMRDNALAKQLCATGHDAFLLPLYLPLTLEESAASPDAPVFFGGLNVYLQQRFSWFRNAPRWLDRFVDHPAVLKMLGRFAGMTQGGDTGAITVSMLQGEAGAQNRELDKLIEWIQRGERPDAIWLSTGLLAGVARRIRKETGRPRLLFFAGGGQFFGQPARALACRGVAGNGAAHCGIGRSVGAQPVLRRPHGKAPVAATGQCGGRPEWHGA